MSFREELLKEHSKRHTVYLMKKIGPNQASFDVLIGLFLGDEYRVTQRASWVVSHCIDEYPWLIENHLRAIIENLQKPVHVAVKRNTLRILQFIDIPEDLMGLTADLCFSFLNSGKETIAVKIFAMTVLFNIVKKYPELDYELKISIEEQMPFGSGGFKSRGKKILKALAKIRK
jgi:hypothetical protein